MNSLPPPLVKRVSRVGIARYAAATGDYNAQHLDEEHARRIGLPGVIAHGMLSFGFVGQLLTTWCDGDPGRVEGVRLRFRCPVFPGDELTVALTDPRPVGSSVLVDVRVTRGGEQVVVGSARVRAPQPSKSTIKES